MTLLAISLLAKIPLFVGFLVFLVLWIGISMLALYRIGTGLKSTSTAGFLFTRALPLDLAGVLGLVGVLGVTALFFDFGLLALFLLAVAAGYLVSFVAWEILGPLDRPFGSQVLWSGARLLLDERLQKTNNILGAVLLVGLVGAIAYAFFTKEVPSAGATQLIFQVFLAYLAVSFILSVLPLRFAQLGSRNLDEDIRTRILLLQIGGLFGLALYISLLAWSFGAGDGSDLPGSGVGAGFSLAVILVIVGVFTLTSLGPYLLGWRRARGWRRRLLGRRRASIDRMIGILKVPGNTDYAAELVQFKQGLEGELDGLVGRDPLMQRTLAWEDSPDSIPEKEQFVFDTLEDARETDPRLTQIEFLRQLWGHADAIAEELAGYTRKDSRRKKAESHIGFFEDERARIDAALAQETGRNWVWAGASVVILPIIGGVLSKISERVWDIVNTAPG